MQEKILAKLKTQRGTTSNVTDRSLEDLSRSLATIITTDELLTAADFSAAITSIDGNINHYTAEQIKALDKTKADELAKKAKEEADRLAAEELAKANKDKGISPELTALMEQNKKIMETLANLQGEKITTTRAEQLQAVLDKAEPTYKSRILNDFKRMNFESDDDFVEYSNSIKTDVDAQVQLFKERGVSFPTPGANVQVPKDDGRTPELVSAHKIVADAKKAQNQ